MNSAVVRKNIGRRSDLGLRAAKVIATLDALRLELAATLSQNQRLRADNERLRADSQQAIERSTALRRQRIQRFEKEPSQIAQTIAALLKSKGYSAFVAEAPLDTASLQ
jgi:regulator of replication initiation timing